MNILVLGNGYFVAPLRALGQTVLHVHHSPGADVPLEHPSYCKPLLARLGNAGFVPELVIYADDGNLPLLVDPENLPCPSLWFSIDTYCNPWHMAWARGFDATLVAQKDFVAMFTSEGCTAEWFPLFCAGVEDEVPFATRDIPVAFVGTMGHKNNPGRAPFLRAFRAQHPLVMLTGDFRTIFLRSRIVLNQMAFAEVNFRCFEAMACGAALLMEQCDNGLLDIFTPDVDILPPYPRGDAATAARIAAESLARPEHLADVAARGRELVGAKHSALARAQRLLELAAQLRENGSWQARLQQPGAHGRFVRTAFGIIASELNDPALAQVRTFYLQRATQ